MKLELTTEDLATIQPYTATKDIRFYLMGTCADRVGATGDLLTDIRTS